MGQIKLQYHYDDVRKSLEKVISKRGLDNVLKDVQKDVQKGISEQRRKDATAYGMWWLVEREIRLPIQHLRGVEDSHIGSLMEKICKDMEIYDKF